METQATEPSQPAGHKPEHHASGMIKIKPKFNKYIIAIIILAVVVAMIFYFKPVSEETKTPIETPPKEEAAPENVPKEIGEEELVEIEGIDIINVILPVSLSYGSPFSFSFDINNTGNETKNLEIKIKLDDAAVYTKTAELKVNISENFGFTFLQADASYPKVGGHTAVILADNAAIYSKKFEVEEKLIAPNMEIRSFSAVPVTNININDNVTLIAYVRNVGSLDAKNATIRFFIDDVLLKEESADIAQQITTPFKATWVPEKAGSYVLKAVAYASGDVYPDNNEYSFNVTVTNSTA